MSSEGEVGVSLPEASVRLSEVMLRELVYLQAEKRIRAIRERKQKIVEAQAGVMPVDSPSAVAAVEQSQAGSGPSTPQTDRQRMFRAASSPAMQRTLSNISPLQKVLLEVEDALPPLDRLNAIRMANLERVMSGRPKVVLKPRLPITLAYELGSSTQWAR